MLPAAGQAPKQEAVDGPEGELATFRALSRAGYVVEQPGSLGCREIGVEQKPGLFRNHGLAAIGLELLAQRIGAPVLPDNRIVDRFAAVAIPDDRGFALIGDADRRDLGCVPAALRQRALDHRQGIAPDVLGIVFDPAVPGEVLGKFLLGDTRGFAGLVEQEGPAGGRTLIDGQDAVWSGHVVLSFVVIWPGAPDGIIISPPCH